MCQALVAHYADRFRGDLVSQAVAILLEQHPEGWRGNTAKLLEALKSALRNAKRSKLMEEKGWPSTPTWLGRQLRRSAPILRKVSNIGVTFGVDLRASAEGDKDGLAKLVGSYGD